MSDTDSLLFELYLWAKHSQKGCCYGDKGQNHCGFETLEKKVEDILKDFEPMKKLRVAR